MRDFIKSLSPNILFLFGLLIFGFGLLLTIAILATIIALGKVHQESSYGLEIVLGSLTTLAGGFAQWAFSGADKIREEATSINKRMEKD